MKNVDRNSATYHSVTVNDFTVVITEFKPKAKKERKEKKSAADKNDSVNKSDSSNGKLDDEDSDSKGGRENNHSMLLIFMFDDAMLLATLSALRAARALPRVPPILQ